MSKTWSDRFLATGAFMCVFSAYLIIGRGPAANKLQLVFRMGLAILGLIFVAVGRVLKARQDHEG